MTTTTKMPEATLEALRGSIAHWERLAKCATIKTVKLEGYHSVDCPLCKAFQYTDDNEYCLGCPVAHRANESGCRGTPYIDVSLYIRDVTYFTTPFDAAEWRRLATAELDFLKSLLPHEEA